MGYEQHKLNAPARFRSGGRVHVLKDGVPFYTFDKPGEFTLPAGTYQVSGGSIIGRMKARTGHKTRQRPRFKIPRTVRLVFADNPNKCSISLPDGIIICDPSLRELPSFCLVFILFHEIGHYYYEGEKECDRFAAEEMHRRGYNPSQIHLATWLTMGDHERRSCNFETAKNLKP
jgi:hypothetical protein